MTDKEIRRLGKTEMLSIIRDQESELEKTRADLAQLQAKLEDKEVMLDECGSIAEASLKVNDVFQAAQGAADSYLKGVQQSESTAEERISKMEEKAKAQMETRLKNTEILCERMKTDSKKRAEAYWAELKKELKQYFETHSGLLELMNATGVRIKIPDMPEIKSPPAPGVPTPAQHLGSDSRERTGTL